MLGFLTVNIESFEYIIAALLIVLIIIALYLVIWTKKYKYKSDYFNMLFDCVPGGIFLCVKDDVLSIKYFNNGFAAMLGYEKEELPLYHDNKLINIIGKDDLGFAFKSLYEQLGAGDDFELKIRMVKKDGTTAWVLWKGKKYSGRKREYLNCEVINITDYIYSEHKQKIDEERYRIVAETSDSVIYEYNIKDKTIFYTHKYKHKFGEDPVTENFPDAFIDSGKIHKDDVKKFLSEYNKILYGQPSGKIEIRIMKATGEYIWCEMRYTSIFDDNGMPIRVIGKYVDIDQVKKETESLKKANQLDSFTGFYNKIAILQNIEKYFSENAERKHALYFLDIDDFKSINDNYGHLYGDKLLMQIAEAVKKQFRHSDLIGRIGGDEFLILVKDYIDDDFIFEKADALCRSISQMSVEKDISVTASVGIALFPQHGNLLASLYEKADIALYAAKSEGKNKYKLYTEELSANLYNSAYQSKTFPVYSGVKKKISEHTAFLYGMSEDLSGGKNIKDALGGALQKFGSYFSADRVYIYEFDEGGKARISYEWRGKNIKSLKNTQQETLISKDDYEKNFNADNIFYCKNAAELKNPLYSGENDALSFIHCKIAPNGKFKGFIGCDICSEPKMITREEIEALLFISKAIEKGLARRKENA